MPLHIFTYITSGVSAFINFWLIFLLLRHTPRKKGNIFLAIWIFFLTLSFQILGSLIMATSDPKKAFFLYQISAGSAALVGFFYLFIKEFLEPEKRKWTDYLIVFYTIFILAMGFVVKGLFVKEVYWDNTTQFYIFKPNIFGFVLAAPLLSLWLLGVYKLFKTYKKSRSAIERNRLKYLLLGAFLPYIGMALVVAPFPAIRRYPLDMFSITLSTICLAYGVLKYRLLDISIIVKKGLLYSILTIAVTGVYLSFSLLLQFFLQKTGVPISLPALISTALVVALVFQPLQASTQRFIDKVFFRRKYDPQKLVASLSEVFSKSLDLNFLASELVNQICDTMQIEKAIFFLVNEKTNKLQILKARNVGDESLDFTIAMDSPFVQFLSRSQGPQLNEFLEQKNIPLEPMNALNLELFVPLKSRGQIKGILALGPKLSKEYYSLEEFKLLGTIANSATLALENASLFSQIQESKTTLEIKVGARTKELKELTENLDEQVKERTKELQEKVSELEKFYKLTVGRELKMMELKKKLKKPES